MKRFPATFFPGATPVDIYLLAYQEWLKMQNITGNTKRVYLSRIKQFLRFLDYAELEYEPLENPESLHKAASLYLEFLKNSKRQNITINANIDALKNFFAFLNLEAKIELRRKQCHRSHKKILSQEEQAFLLNCLEKEKSARHKALFLVLLYTGVRISDCAALTLSNIGPNVMSITMPNGERIFLNQATQLALKQWLEERRKITDNHNDAPLWLTNRGEGLSISGINFVLRRIGRQAKLEISAEVLRRTGIAFASK